MKTKLIPGFGSVATRARLAVVGAAVLAVGACASVAVAWSGGTGSGYTELTFTNPDQADVTTCPPFPVWARGRASNTYKVFPRRPDGTYLVVEEFHADYRTLAGQSPGACNNGTPDNGNTVGDGVKVELTDSSTWIVHNGTFDPNATCVTVNPSCFIPRFTTSFFGPSAWFEYAAEVGIYETHCNGSWTGTGPNVSQQQTGDITGAKTDCDE
jgi:hypothetical protein